MARALSVSPPDSLNAAIAWALLDCGDLESRISTPRRGSRADNACSRSCSCDVRIVVPAWAVDCVAE